jgi:hypothetical protein
MVKLGQLASVTPNKRHPGRRLELKDAIALLGLGAILLIYGLLYIDYSTPPAEDAAILMRYAQHLAGGHGIVWNIGEGPVDGATDFLFLGAIAGLAQFGLSVLAAARLLNLVSHVLTVSLIYVAVAKLQGSSRWAALLSATYLALGPGFRYIEHYFGTPFFALAAVGAFWFAEACRQEPESSQATRGFALTSLALGLIRPDGVFLAGLMLLGLVVATGFRQSRKAVLHWTATYAVLGGAYFLWRWHYFGNPLPIAFYVKGGGHLHLDGLAASVRGVVKLGLPFLPVFLLGVFSSPRTRRETLFTLLPVVGFTAIWVLLTPEMEFEMRFQYALLPLILISWPGLLAKAWEDWQLPRWRSLSVGARHRARALLMVISAGILLRQFIAYKALGLRVDYCNLAIAQMLADYQQKGYALATNQSGLLPLYSHWRALDTWGLNDQAIAHGADLTDRLDNFRPQLIHVHYSVVVNMHDLMEQKVKAYAERKGYRLAAAFGSNLDDIDFYYVQPAFPDADQIVQRIESTWKTNSHGNLDFTTFKLP